MMQLLCLIIFDSTVILSCILLSQKHCVIRVGGRVRVTPSFLEECLVMREETDSLDTLEADKNKVKSSL